MPDISIPGLSSRFDTDKIVDSLMKVERIPRDRIEKNVENLNLAKTAWQSLGRRISALREGANQLYSYQNPFSERAAVSSNSSVMEASAGREARDQKHDFTIKQLAQADKFISKPLSADYKVPAGAYNFSIADTDLSFKFNGGSTQEFSDTLNRRGTGKIASSLIAVKPGTKSFVIESLITGAENKLQFGGDALTFALDTGIVTAAPLQPKPEFINIKAVPTTDPERLKTAGDSDSLKIAAQTSATIAANNGISPVAGMTLRFETSLSDNPTALAVKTANAAPLDGTQTEDQYAEESQTQSAEEGVAQSELKPNSFLLKFTDGSELELSSVKETFNFQANTFNLFELSGGKTLSELEIRNNNTQTDVSIRNIQVMNPNATQKTGAGAETEPVHPITRSQDAIVLMDGIEIERPSNNIDDLIPGLKLTLRGASEAPVKLDVENNNEAVKDAIITFVGSYNRLMAELNVLTRRDEKLVSELDYLSADDKEELRGKLGLFAGDTALNKFRSDLVNAVTASYPTDSSGLVMLANFGISTDARRTGTAGYDPSRMRGYLEIDEGALDLAIAANSDALKQLMGRDNDGDLIIDGGVAYTLDRTARPFVEIGGVVAGKTGSLDTRIAGDTRRMETIDRQLARKESDLRIQYGKMEDAYTRMDQMSRSLENFSAQSGGGSRR
jgi:flagellar hook-associated protein 2